MSEYVGGWNENGEWIKYALVYVDEHAWSEVRGRVGYNRDDYCELLAQFGESADYHADVLPAAEELAERCYENTGRGCNVEIHGYSPTNPRSIIDTVVVHDDGSWEHDNIMTQGYGTDHCFD